MCFSLAENGHLISMQPHLSSPLKINPSPNHPSSADMPNSTHVVGFLRNHLLPEVHDFYPKVSLMMTKMKSLLVGCLHLQISPNFEDVILPNLSLCHLLLANCLLVASSVASA